MGGTVRHPVYRDVHLPPFSAQLAPSVAASAPPGGPHSPVWPGMWPGPDSGLQVTSLAATTHHVKWSPQSLSLTDTHESRLLWVRVPPEVANFSLKNNYLG